MRNDHITSNTHSNTPKPNIFISVDWCLKNHKQLELTFDQITKLESYLSTKNSVDSNNVHKIIHIGATITNSAILLHFPEINSDDTQSTGASTDTTQDDTQ